MRTVALDLGGRRIDFCEIGEGGVLIRKTVKRLKDLLVPLGPNTPPARVAFEACREGWHVAKTVKSWGHTPVMVDTTRVKELGVGRHGRKNDRIDTERLAIALKEDRIPEAHLLSEGSQELRFQLSVRRLLVDTRAKYVTAIREIVRAQGRRVAGCATDAFLQKLSAVELDERTRLLVWPLRDSLEILNRQIAETDQKLDQLCGRDAVLTRLMTAPGIGLMVAAAFRSVIDDARRFRRAHEVESYLGLVPDEESTGGKRKLGSISKAGNPYLRALLVEAGWCLLRSHRDDPLAKWGRQVASRRGKRIAVVALARRLTGILWAMWRDHSCYDPERLGKASAHGLEHQARQIESQAQALKRAAQKLALRRRRVSRVLQREVRTEP
jgi:transposase